MKGFCNACKKETDLIKHHINYKQNKTVLVCRHCHKKIHSGTIKQFVCEDPFKIVEFPKTGKGGKEAAIRKHLKDLHEQLVEAPNGMPGHIIRIQIRLLKWVIE